jgi:hypothetical protein
MKILALLTLTALSLGAQNRPFCSWNCSGVPVAGPQTTRGLVIYPWPGRHWRSYRQPAPRPRAISPGFSTGTAVAGAAIAGVLGYELGRKIQQHHQPTADQPCNAVTINGDTIRVCKNQQGDWMLAK